MNSKITSGLLHLSPVSRRESPTLHSSLYDLNPGFLTMGFAEANPRQLAPTVGKTQVGVTISAVPSPAVDDSTTSSALDNSATRRHPSTPARFDPTRVHRTLDVFNSYGKIYINLTEKTRKIASARLDARLHQQTLTRSLQDRKNVRVTGALNGDSELISKIPSVERFGIEFSKICENFSKFQRLDLPRRLPH